MKKRIYNILDPARMMRIKDTKVTRRTHMPRKTKGVVLIDSGDLSKINVDCEINLRSGCWELYFDEVLDMKKIAEEMDAVAYIQEA